MAEMLLRAQAARRALSALADETVRNSGECGVRTDLSTLGNGGGGALQMSGNRSDAISKLAQSRAGALSGQRPLLSPQVPSSPLPLRSVERPPPSPLVEITNRVHQAGISVRGVLGSLESGGKPAVGGKATIEIAGHREEQTRILHAPGYCPNAGVKAATGYPSWTDASSKSPAQTNSPKSLQPRKRKSLLLNQGNIENTSPSVSTGNYTNPYSSRSSVHGNQGTHDRKCYPLDTVQVADKMQDVGLKSVHGGLTFQGGQNLVSVDEKHTIMEINEITVTSSSQRYDSEFESEMERHTQQKSQSNYLLHSEVGRIDSALCVDRVKESESTHKSGGLFSSLKVKSDKDTFLDNETSANASGEHVPAVNSPTAASGPRSGRHKSSQAATNKSVHETEDRIGMVIKLQIRAVNGVGRASLEHYSLSLHVENPLHHLRLSLPARNLSMNSKESLWEDVIRINEESVLEFLFQNSEAEPWWKSSLPCSSLWRALNKERQFVHLDLPLESTGSCKQRDKCSVDVIVDLNDSIISIPSQYDSQRGFVRFLQCEDAQSVDEPACKLLGNPTKSIDPRKMINGEGNSRPPRENELLCPVLDDIWDAGMTLVSGNDGIFEVESLVTGGPADKEGIAVGDLVFEAASQELRGLQRNKVNTILKGPLGSTINCVVWRQGYKAPCKISLIREVSSQLGTAEGVLPLKTLDALSSSEGDLGYSEPAVATCTPTAFLSSLEASKAWSITFLDPAEHIRREESQSTQLLPTSDLLNEKQHVKMHGNFRPSAQSNTGSCCTICPSVECFGRIDCRESSPQPLAYSTVEISENSKDASVEEDDWILTWSVADVCAFFRDLRLDGEGIAEAAERAALVERHLIDGTILAGLFNECDGDSWLARTLALVQSKIVELREHLEEARRVHQCPHKDLIAGSDFSGNRHSSSLKMYSPAGTQDQTMNCAVNLNLQSDVLRSQSDIVPGDGLRVTGMGAYIHRRRVREWTEDDVLAFLRDLVPYSSAKDTEFRNGNIRRYKVTGKELLDTYLTDDKFLQHKLLLMPAQAARARGVLNSYARPESGFCQLYTKSSSQSQCGDHAIEREKKHVEAKNSHQLFDLPSKHHCTNTQRVVNQKRDAMPEVDVKPFAHSASSDICSESIVANERLLPKQKRSRSDAELWYSKALASRLGGGIKETQLELLQNALECDSHHVNSLCDCGVLMQEGFKNFDAAERYYNRALSADPNHVTCLCNYAILLAQELDLPSKAKEMYERALQIDPQNVQAMHSLASLLSDHSGDYKAAGTMYERVLQLNPHHVPTLCNYGALLDSVFGDYEGSRALYQRALNIYPDHTLTLCNYGALLNDIYRDYPGSERLFCRSLQTNPNHVATLCNYGWLQMDGLNSPLAAWVLFEKALELEPSHAQTLFNYGCLLEKCSIFDGAEIKYQNALKSNPRLISCRRQYASFLVSVRKDHAAASVVLKEIGVVRGVL